MYTHLDLFSGIGGFALGLQRTGKFKTIAFCEYDEFCHRVLRKNFGNVPIIKDIKSFDTERFIHEHGRPFIITGGFPCQPFSQAGLRQGTQDEKGRDLWSEMHRVISSLKPQWVIGENVSGFATLPMVFERTATDLETSGYQTVCFNIPACATNLKHERQRLWIVAHANGNSQSNDPNNDSKGKWLHDVPHSNSRRSRSKHSTSFSWEKERIRSEHEGSGVGSQRKKYDVPHSESSRHRGGLSEERGTEGRLILQSKQGRSAMGSEAEGCSELSGDRKDLDDPYSEGLQGQRKHFRLGGKQRKNESPKTSTQKNVSQTNSKRGFESRLGGKLSDGLSDRMDESEFGVPRVTTEKQDRAARLKAIGNAVIPTIPEIIARAIIEAEGA